MKRWEKKLCLCWTVVSMNFIWTHNQIMFPLNFPMWNGGGGGASYSQINTHTYVMCICYCMWLYLLMVGSFLCNRFALSKWLLRNTFLSQNEDLMQG
jgi:hypothetical protein